MHTGSNVKVQMRNLNGHTTALSGMIQLRSLSPRPHGKARGLYYNNDLEYAFSTATASFTRTTFRHCALWPFTLQLSLHEYK
jgi:hypothetical protein